jgi:malate/lactate dehydrogenase
MANIAQKMAIFSVPVTMAKGWEKIVDYKLNENRQAAFNKETEAVGT